MTVTVLMTPLLHAVAGWTDIGAFWVDSTTPTEPEKSELSRPARPISDIAELAPVCAASCWLIWVWVPPLPFDGLENGLPAPPPEQPARVMAATIAKMIRVRMVERPFLGEMPGSKLSDAPTNCSQLTHKSSPAHEPRVRAQ